MKVDLFDALHEGATALELLAAQHRGWAAASRRTQPPDEAQSKRFEKTAGLYHSAATLLRAEAERVLERTLRGEPCATFDAGGAYVGR